MKDGTNKLGGINDNSDLQQENCIFHTITNWNGDQRGTTTNKNMFTSANCKIQPPNGGEFICQKSLGKRVSDGEKITDSSLC